MQMYVKYADRPEVSISIEPHASFDTTLQAIVVAYFGPTGIHSESIALRTEQYELVTEENAGKKLIEKAHYMLCEAPAFEARNMVQTLKNTTDERIIKLTMFSLQKLIKEETFAMEFCSHHGLRYLMKVIHTSTGNALAYALSSVQNLTDHSFGWDSFDDAFISRLVTLAKQSLVNICRPATLLLAKLIAADPSSPSLIKYGYDIVAQSLPSDLIPLLIKRLVDTDASLQLNSLRLINTLAKYVPDSLRYALFEEFHHNYIRDVISSLMFQSKLIELDMELVEFQRCFIWQLYYEKSQHIDLNDERHNNMMQSILEFAESHMQIVGFLSGNPKREFEGVGLLGLSHLYLFLQAEREFALKTLNTTKIPLASASIHLSQILCEYWNINTGYSTKTTKQPLVFMLTQVHRAALIFFVRMWTSACASTKEFHKIVNLVTSHLRFVFRDEQGMTMEGFDQEMRSVGYQIVKERQAQDTDEDDMMNRLPVKRLKEKLYKESFEFMKEQRIKCLEKGAWFLQPKESLSKDMYRFYKLAPNRKYLHYSNLMEKKENELTLFDLEEKLDVMQLTDILTRVADTSIKSKAKSKSLLSVASFSISLLTADTQFELICENATQYSQWLDGLNMLLDRNIGTKETAELIENLTDVSTRVWLLDILNLGLEDQIENASPKLPPLPSNLNFYYK